MESFRAVGYTLGAALADLVDNSIYAGALEVSIDFHWGGANSAIVVSDNGGGMDVETLVEAMRLGTFDPSEPREPKDLGRFGHGLKTASLSQCRLFTVASRKTGHQVVARYWDLDLLRGEDEWLLRRGFPEGVNRFAHALERANQGTVVVWQKLDRVLQPEAGFGEATRDEFLQRGASIKQHLSMVFHRFLEGPNPLRIAVNGDHLKPWDPFLRDHPKTQWLEKEATDVFGKAIEVRPYVLPYHTFLTPEQHSRAGGQRGWNAMQGFYIYRARRLIVAGDYLGLKLLQEPHYSLARIQVDLPNTMDSEWQLDVKKASAIPPVGLRTRLDKIARITRKRAAAVYRHRARIERREHAGQEELVWQLRSLRGKKFVSVNRKHPIISEALALGGEAGIAVRRVLAVVERSLPLESLAYQFQETPDEFVSNAEQADDSEIVAQGLALYDVFRGKGMSPQTARARLILIEPFGDSAALMAKLDEMRVEKEP